MSSMLQVLNPDGTADARLDPGLSAEQSMTLYRHMLLVRIMDTRMLNLQRQGRIGFYGTATGEEAAVIGSGFAFRPTDWIFPALRQGGILLLRGYPLERYVAQCIGNANDILKGRQMPCHYSDREFHVVSWGSCIGTQLPHATGAAMAARIKGDPVVMGGYMGDGATSEAEFHVALNFAGVFRSPVVFLCQNNQFAISVPAARQFVSESIAIKAESYGFPGVKVDGNDVLAVYRATREAVDRARAGKGPTLIEAFTYRRGGHSSSDDPTRYRDEDITRQWEARDPIERYRKHLTVRKLWDEARDRALQEELNLLISEAIRKAEAAGAWPPDSLFDDVYATLPPILAEQRAALREDLQSRGSH